MTSRWFVPSGIGINISIECERKTTFIKQRIVVGVKPSAVAGRLDGSWIDSTICLCVNSYALSPDISVLNCTLLKACLRRGAHKGPFSF